MPSRLVNDALVAARLSLIVYGVRDGAIPRTDLLGLCVRVLKFSSIADPATT